MARSPHVNTPGFIAARDIVREEFEKAQKEVDLASKPASTFSAANRDRAVVRRDVLAKVLRDLS